MMFSQQPTRLVPLSAEVRERARSLWQMGFPQTPPTPNTFKPLSQKVTPSQMGFPQTPPTPNTFKPLSQKANPPLSKKVRSAMKSGLKRRESAENLKQLEGNSRGNNDGTCANISRSNRPTNASRPRSSAKTQIQIHHPLKLRSFDRERPRTQHRLERAQKPHNPAELCYLLLRMGALLHAEPKPRACLQLFSCDEYSAEKVLFFAYLLGARPGLPTRWLFPFVQKRIFSFLTGFPPHYIGLWNVGGWLENKTEDTEKSDAL